MKPGYNLREIRTRKGLSQGQIADILETTQQQYSKYELGTQELPARHIIKLCNYYKISADKILGLKEEE